MVINVELLHCCLEKGVQIRAKLDKPLKISDIKKFGTDNTYLFQTKENGIYRFIISGLVTLSGVIGDKNISMMFLYQRRNEALDVLEEHFVGIKNAYQSVCSDNLA